MPKLATKIQRRVSSIFRPRRHHFQATCKNNVDTHHVDKKKKNDDDLLRLTEHSSEEETVKLEESESDLTLSLSLGSSSSLISVVDPENTSKTTAAAATSATTAAHPAKKQVSFDTVTVRHYDLILGDNPYCKYPLALGWDYRLEQEMPVQEYEATKHARKQQADYDRIQPRLYVAPEDPNKFPADFYLQDVYMESDFDDELSRKLLAELNLQERRTRLRSFGYSEAALRQAERRRRVTLALEWNKAVEGDSDSNPPTPTPAASAAAALTTKFPYSSKFVTRYIT